MTVSICFFNDHGDKDSAGAAYDIEMDVLPRINEHLLLDIDNKKFNELAKTTAPTSNFKVVYVVHAIEDFDSKVDHNVTLFVKPIYDLF